GRGLCTRGSRRRRRRRRPRGVRRSRGGSREHRPENPASPRLHAGQPTAVTRLLVFWSAHRAELMTLLGQHIGLVFASTLIAVLVAVPLGIFASRRPRLATPLTAVANIVQTVPSLAMFGFLLPVPLVGGVGARAALVVLILYGLLPIVRTTIAGLRGIDP